MAAKAGLADPMQTQTKSKKNKKKRSKGATAAQSTEEELQANGATETQDNDGNDSDASANSEADTVEEIYKNVGAVSEKHANGTSSGSSAAATRLETAAKERDELRVQVTELRKELENIQQKHQEDVSRTRKQLEETQTGKEHAENRYNKLLGQVNTIKTQLGERLQSDAAELSQCREQIETLEDENKTVRKEQAELQTQIAELTTQKGEQEKEISELRGRTNLSQQNWAKEKDEIFQREAQIREDFESAKQAMQDWEVLATEERSLREGLSDRVSELEEQLSSQQEAYDRAVTERDDQSSTVDGLQRALEEVHTARKQERRELVESSETQIEELRRALKVAEQSSSSAQEELHMVKQELARASPFEKEVKEKNLLIGKLRHEAVILNDHLTKALRFLKRGKPEDNVDRQLVTNHFLHFLALERTDPKKFQILQLIAALLGWTDEQKESAGLARPGASTSTNLRVPLSTPFRRVSSTASLNPLSSSGPLSPSISGSQHIPLESPTGKESLAELWSDFLEREAEQGSASGGTPRQSRRSSAAGVNSSVPMRSGIMSPTASSPSPMPSAGRKAPDTTIVEEGSLEK